MPGDVPVAQEGGPRRGWGFAVYAEGLGTGGAVDVAVHVSAPSPPHFNLRKIQHSNRYSTRLRAPQPGGAPGSRPMQQPTNYGGVRHELLNEALAAYAPPVQAALCDPSHTALHQKSLSSGGTAERPLSSPSVASAPSAFVKTLGGLHTPHQHQPQQKRHPSLVPFVPPAAVPIGCEPGTGSVEAQATSSWGPLGGQGGLQKAAAGHGPPSLLFSVDSTGCFQPTGACSSSSNTILGAPLPVRPVEPRLAFGQIGDAASAGDFGASPPADGWGPLPVANVPPPVESQPQIGVAAGAATTQAHEGLPLRPGNVTSVSVGFAAGESPVGKLTVEGFTIGQVPVGGAAAGSSSHPPQVLLQQLRDNEKMQRQILRDMQKQQQRWRHLLESCEGPSLGGALGALPESPAASCGAGVPSAFVLTSPEAVPLLQEKQLQQLAPPLQQQMQPGTADGAPLGAPKCGPHACPPREASPGEQHVRYQAAGRQPWAFSDPPGAPGVRGASVGHENAWRSASQLPAAANSGEAQAWSWEQHQRPSLWSGAPSTGDSSIGESLALPEKPIEDLAGSHRGGPLLQPNACWPRKPGRKRRARTAAFDAAPGDLPAAPEAAVGAANSASCGSVTETGLAETAEVRDPEGPCEPAANPHGLPNARRVGGRRRRGRFGPGNKGAPISDVKGPPVPFKSDTKSTSSPQSCSRSPSIARAAACAVLGFGSGMPLQARLAEVTT